MYATRMEIRQAAGEMVICGFDGKTLSAELKDLLREVNPLGLILFARNVESAEHVTELNRELKLHRAQDPLLITVDQEGGRVARVRKPATEWPPMRRLGEIGDPELVRRVGAGLAKELRAMNFDVNFAPVLDVDTNPANPVIGDRSFSRDAAMVGTLGKALIQGLQDNGIGACAKHFPGHGDTDLDSHKDLPHVSHDLDRLRNIEWPPFKTAIEAGVGAVMSAHVVVDALDKVPATLSPHILKKYLRQELGFEGVVCSDDIEMKALADRYTPTQIAEMGVLAGIDVFLPCHKPEVTLELFRGIIRAVEEQVVSHEAILSAAHRARTWRARYFQPPVDTKAHAAHVGSHSGLVAEITSRLA